MTRWAWCSVVVLGAVLGGCRSCAVPDEALKPFPCQVDGGAGQCPSGWRCGGDEKCFDPAQPVASDTPRVCNDDAQCPDGWRCGVRSNGLRSCHARDVGDAYPCDSDADCESGWRCDLSLRCRDIQDRLAPARLSAPQVKRLSPQQDIDVPSHVAVGRVAPAPSARLHAWVVDGGLTVIRQLEDVGLGDVSLSAYTWSVDEAAVANLVVVDRTRTLVELRDGGVTQYVFELDGGSSRGPSWNGFHFRPVDPPLRLPPGALGFRDRELVGVGSTLPQSPVDIGVGPIVDVAAVDEHVIVLTATSVVTVNTGGGNLSADGGTAPLVVNGQPVAAAGWSVRRLFAAGPGPAGNSSAEVVAVELVRGSAESAPQYLLVSGGQTAGPFALCPDGARPLQATLTPEKDSFVARCPAGTSSFGGEQVSYEETSWLVRHRDNGAVTYTPHVDDAAAYPAGARAMASAQASRAHAGRDGHQWHSVDLEADLGPYQISLLRPLVLDRQPDSVLRLAAGGSGGIFASAGDWTFSVQPPLGFVSEFRSNLGDVPQLLGTVDGVEGLIVTRRIIFDLTHFEGEGAPREVVSLAPEARDLQPGTRAGVLTLGSSRLLVVTSNDTLLSADVTEALSSPVGRPAVLRPVLVPTPGVAIKDAAFKSGTEGYLLTNFGVLEASAASADTWFTEARDVRAADRPLRVWWTDEGPRVGLASGHIETLPVPVVLSAALPEVNGQAQEASDLGRLCGDFYAVTPDGLYHLESTGALDAPWVRVNEDLGDLSGARLFESKASLFLATREGRVFELSAGHGADGTPVCP